MTTALESANAVLRSAVRERMEATPADDPKMAGYQLDQGDSETYAEWRPTAFQPRHTGDSLLTHSGVHPTSRAFYELCDQLKETHRMKSADYGSADDPLANIRNGATFVGIEPWRAAMVRLSDKVTRLQTYCRTGSLTFEGVEDTLVDLASYALLTLLTHREARCGTDHE